MNTSFFSLFQYEMSLNAGLMGSSLDLIQYFRAICKTLRWPENHEQENQGVGQLDLKINGLTQEIKGSGNLILNIAYNQVGRANIF